jgi:hypothetical protein
MYDRYIPDSKTKMSFKNKFKISLFIKKIIIGNTFDLLSKLHVVNKFLAFSNYLN